MLDIETGTYIHSHKSNTTIGIYVIVIIIIIINIGQTAYADEPRGQSTPQKN